MQSDTVNRALIFFALTAAQSVVAAEAWRWLPPPESLGSGMAVELPSSARVTGAGEFVAGDIRDATGAQAIVSNAIIEQTNTVAEFFGLIFETVALDASSDAILLASSERILADLSSGALTLSREDIAAAGSLRVNFGNSGTLTDLSAGVSLGSFGVIDLVTLGGIPNSQFSLVGTELTGDVLMLDSSFDSLSISDGSGRFSATNLALSHLGEPVLHFQDSAGVFYALNIERSGDFDITVDGFFVGQAGNSATSNAGGAFLNSFSQATTLTGACAGGCVFAEDSNVTFTGAELGVNTTHGVAWAVVLPPFDFADPVAQTPNGAMAYISAQEITPRNQLPSSGIGTFDSVVGGGSPFHATKGVGALEAFSATVDFASAQLTDVEFSGRFAPGETFTATNAEVALVQADGTFSTGLNGTCSFCGGNLSGNISGGFVSGGDALIGAYGLRPATLSGSEHSIVGSVLATQ